MTSLDRRLAGPWAGALFVVIVAALLRLPALDSVPPGLSFDEAGNGVAALDVIHGQFRLWWPIGGGKEPLMAYLLPLLFWLLGPTKLALRIYAAAMGLITVAGTYWLASEMFAAQATAKDNNQASSFSASPIVPVVAALGLATAFWHVAYSRIAFRALGMPAVEVLALAWLWRALRKSGPLKSNQRWLDFVGAGFLIGLGPYTYLTARFVPVALVLFFAAEAALAWLRGGRPLVFRCFRGLALSATVALLIFLPLAIFFAQHPAAFVERGETVSIFNPSWNQGDLWGTLLHIALATLGTFAALTGDPNPLGNLPGRPMLGFVLAPFFWLGVGISVWGIVRFLPEPRRPKEGRATRELPTPPASRSRQATPGLSPYAPYLFLLCWWAVMLLPGILAPEGAPHHLRIIGTAPVTYILVAVGLRQVSNLLIGRAKNQRKSSKLLVGRAVDWLPVLIFLPIGLVTARDYFVRWAKLPELYMAYDVYAVELAGQMAAEKDPSVVYVIPMDLRAGHEARHYTLDFLYRGGIPYFYLPVDEMTAGARLTEFAAGRNSLRVVRWLQDKHAAADEREVVTFLLAGVAQLTDEDVYPAYRVETWLLPSAHTTFALPTIDRLVGANFGDVLRLEAADLSVRGGTVAVALRWAPQAATDVDYKASLRLVAADGAVAAQKDRSLRHNWHQGTSLWPSETVNEYYLMPAVPPGEYEVRLLVYHPETLAPLAVAGSDELSLGTAQAE